MKMSTTMMPRAPPPPEALVEASYYMCVMEQGLRDMAPILEQDLGPVGAADLMQQLRSRDGQKTEKLLDMCKAVCLQLAAVADSLLKSKSSYDNSDILII